MSRLVQLPITSVEPQQQLAQVAIQTHGTPELHARLGSWLVRILSLDFIFGDIVMFHGLLLAVVVTLMATISFLMKRRRDKRHQLESHSITAEKLHELLEAKRNLTLLDLRVPLDFLAHTEIIPGARRIAPSEIIADPNIISKDEDYVLYCTCPGEISSEVVLETALQMGFLRVKVLAGGIEAWKQMGYPVEPYVMPFHLDVQ